MPQDIVIRRERPDQPEVVALLHSLDGYLASLYPPEANHIMDVASLCAPEVRFFVARLAGPQGGRAVGTGAVRVMPGEPATLGQRYGEVKRMYVVPELRGQRLGVAIIERLEGALRDDGVGFALLETGREQAEAVRLYERCGYMPRGAFGGYPVNGLSVFYGKRLQD